jgi:hypothetical protein
VGIKFIHVDDIEEWKKIIEDWHKGVSFFIL